jgi:hypothetical protein
MEDIENKINNILTKKYIIDDSLDILMGVIYGKNNYMNKEKMDEIELKGMELFTKREHYNNIKKLGVILGSISLNDDEILDTFENGEDVYTMLEKHTLNNIEKYEDEIKEIYNNITEIFYKTQKKIITRIKEQDYYKEMLSKSINFTYKQPEKQYLNLKNIYTPEHNGELFISFDIVKGNATVLLHLIPEILGYYTEENEHKWNIIINEESEYKIIRESKMFRQMTLGKLIKNDNLDKLVIDGLKYITYKIYTLIKDIIDKNNKNGCEIVNYNHDEIVIRLKDSDIENNNIIIEKMRKAHLKLYEEHKSLNGKIKMEIFKLERVSGDGFSFYKKYVNNKIEYKSGSGNYLDKIKESL